MKLVKNIKLGIASFSKVILIFLAIATPIDSSEKSSFLEGNFVELKILDKVSSKNKLLKIEIGKEKKFKDLLIKALRCKNSEFDDNPEITAYLQVKDQNNPNNDEVFVFNGWTFSSSPTIKTFDHPVYDLWLIRCY